MKTYDLSNNENSCGSCRFSLDDTAPAVVICRHDPPTVLMNVQGERFTQWPLVGALQVCGRYAAGPRRTLISEAVVTATDPEKGPAAH